ncbi:MAG: hypothetical protein J6X55_02090 [Victivallales bacterium]|nr:hypothetical protein [Victivallales bacterium]
MRRPISWTEKTSEGKKETRVTINGDNVKWQFLQPNSEKWDYDSKPTEEDWQILEEKITNLMQRGHFLASELELVKRRGGK